MDNFGFILLNGYGGFEIFRMLMYDGVLGWLWLVCGGIYVLVNICGGGEYGFGWYM